jgi:hypothetical protein
MTAKDYAEYVHRSSERDDVNVPAVAARGEEVPGGCGTPSGLGDAIPKPPTPMSPTIRFRFIGRVDTANSVKAPFLTVDGLRALGFSDIEPESVQKLNSIAAIPALESRKSRRRSTGRARALQFRLFQAVMNCRAKATSVEYEKVWTPGRR